jgi:hypothetical protein
MMFTLLSFLIAGLVSFAMQWIFFALLPLLAVDGQPISPFKLKWQLVVPVLIPATAIAIFGPCWLYEVVFGRDTPKDQRLWFILAGVGLHVACMHGALRSPAGKRYLLRLNRVA